MKIANLKQKALAAVVGVSMLGVPAVASAQDWARRGDYRPDYNRSYYGQRYEGGYYGGGYNGNRYSADRYNGYSDGRGYEYSRPAYSQGYYDRDDYYEHRRSGERSAAIIGGSAAAGAVVGAIAGGGKGAAIGAAIGGIGGLIVHQADRHHR